MKCFIKLQHGLFNARLSVKEIKVQINVAALSTFNVGCVIGIILNFDKDIRIKLHRITSNHRPPSCKQTR